MGIEPTVKETVEVKVEDSTIERQTEIRKQEIHLEEQKEEVLIKKEGQIKIVKEKGAKGLKDLLNKDNKVSSEISVSSDDSTEVGTQNPQAIEPGQIKITVHKARDIEKRGMFGKADPYVIMTHKDQKAKSKTIKNNYNPEWDFTAKFDIKKEVTEGITISVFDDDIGKDDALGQKILDISAIIKSQHKKNQWIPLENCKTGEVLISAEFVPLALVEKSTEVEKSLDSTPVKEATKESKADPKNTEDAKRKDPKYIEASKEAELKPTERIIETKDSKVVTTIVQQSDEEKKVALVLDSAVSKPQKKLEAGQIHITVIKARDIEKKGNFGKADPYVKMTLGNQKAKSATVKNNHNPEFNFEATFKIDENTSEGANIAVFDDDFGKDDSLGSKTLDIHSIQEHRQMLNQWIPLENCKSGEVLLSAEFLPHGSVQKSKGIESTVKPDSTKEVLKQIEPTVKDTVEVKVQDSTITKEIVEESETAKIPEKDFVSETKEKTQVIVKDSNVTESVVTSPTPKKTFEAGQLLLTVFKARDIEKKGNFGKADPYVQITLDKQKAKSATVKNNHNPEWNFKAAFDINESTTENITIAVFDDDFGKDDSLGNAIVDISKVQEQKQLLNQWIPLEKCKSGEVLISAEFIPQAH